MWTIFKVFIEFVTILLVFYVLVFWPWGMWGLSSPTRGQTLTPWIGRQSLNHWTTREVPRWYSFIFYLFIYLFIYFWLCWVFVSGRGLSPVAASGGHSSSRCAGLSLSRPLLLRNTGSRRAGSAVVAHRLSCSAVCGIFPDQGSNPCPLHWQADSQPLRHQGSPDILKYWVLLDHGEGWTKELSKPKRMAQWRLKQQRWLVSLSTKAALLKEGL